MRQFNYWSWEDGLWDLLQKKRIPKKSIVLLPDFYCMDVVENIKNHGYRVAFYKLNKQLQISKGKFLRAVKRNKPAVIVVFHPLGIRSTLMTHPTWIRNLSPSTLLIEDAVHILMDPQDITLYADNHIVMTSLRKVSPLPGSFMYGTAKGLDFRPAPMRMSRYSTRSFLFYGLYRMMTVAAYLFRQPHWLQMAHTVMLKRHDDVIGDSIVPHGGYPFIPTLYSWINFQRVYKMKRHQLKQYHASCAGIFGRGSDFYRIPMRKHDAQYLRAYPVALKKKASKDLLAYLSEKNIITYELFRDCPWSKRRSILYFPLGFHIGKQDIRYVTQTLETCKNGVPEETQELAEVHSPHLLLRAASYFLAN